MHKNCWKLWISFLVVDIIILNFNFHIECNNDFIKCLTSTCPIRHALKWSRVWCFGKLASLKNRNYLSDSYNYNNPLLLTGELVARFYLIPFRDNAFLLRRVVRKTADLSKSRWTFLIGQRTSKTMVQIGIHGYTCIWCDDGNRRNFTLSESRAEYFPDEINSQFSTTNSEHQVWGHKLCLDLEMFIAISLLYSWLVGCQVKRFKRERNI